MPWPWKDGDAGGEKVEGKGREVRGNLPIEGEFPFHLFFFYVFHFSFFSVSRFASSVFLRIIWRFFFGRGLGIWIMNLSRRFLTICTYLHESQHSSSSCTPNWSSAFLSIKYGGGRGVVFPSC